MICCYAFETINHTFIQTGPLFIRLLNGSDILQHRGVRLLQIMFALSNNDTARRCAKLSLLRKKLGDIYPWLETSCYTTPCLSFCFCISRFPRGEFLPVLETRTCYKHWVLCMQWLELEDNHCLVVQLILCIWIPDNSSSFSSALFFSPEVTKTWSISPTIARHIPTNAGKQLKITLRLSPMSG